MPIAHPPNHTQCFAQPFERLSLDFRSYYISTTYIPYRLVSKSQSTVWLSKAGGETGQIAY